MDNRAVSAVLGYIMMLAVVTLLISGLFFAAGNFVEDEQERAIRAELEVVGNRLAADIAAVDRLALSAGSSGAAELTSDLPRSTAGKTYQVAIDEVSGASGVYHINLSTSDPVVEVNVRVRSETTVDTGTVSGGDVKIVYDGATVEVRDA